MWVLLSLKSLENVFLEHSDPELIARDDKSHGDAVLAQNGPPCVTAYATPAPPSPLSQGRLGLAPLVTTAGRQPLGNSSLASREPLFIPVLSGTTALNSKRMAFGFLQSVAHSKPLESFRKRRCELSSSAGEHSNHSVLTRLHSMLVMRAHSSQPIGWLPMLSIGHRVSHSSSLAVYPPSISTENLNPGKPLHPGQTRMAGHLLTGNQPGSSQNLRNHQTHPGLRDSPRPNASTEIAITVYELIGDRLNGLAPDSEYLCALHGFHQLPGLSKSVQLNPCIPGH